MKMKKQMSLFLAALLLFSLFVPITAAGEIKNRKKIATYSSGVFTDVPSTAWYYPEVANAYSYGLASGVGNHQFNPAGSVTVAEAIVFAARANALYNGRDLSDISAPTTADWYSGYVAYAEKNGICKTGEFTGRYTKNATRLILGKLLANALPESEFTVINQNFTAIPDMKTETVGYTQILMLFKAGVLTGSDAYANFKADSNITRAETVAIVNRVLDPSQRKAFTPLVGPVKLSDSALSLRPGASATLRAAAANGTDNGGKIAWKSSDEAVATVTGEGVVTAVAIGTANIFSTDTNGSKNSPDCVVTVSEPKALSSVEIFKNVSPAVFYIELYDDSGKALASATGFFATPDGVAYTNYHVIYGASSAKITMPDGTAYTDIKVTGFNRLNDIAVLKVGGSASFPYVKLGSSGQVLGGERVYAIGNPEGLVNTISDGMVSSTASHPYSDTTYAEAVYIQTSAPISPGSSGGVLVNELGEVIGITALGSTSGQNLNFAVPIDLAKEIKPHKSETLKELETHLYGDFPDYEEKKTNSSGDNTSVDSAQAVDNGSTVFGTLSNYKAEEYFSVRADAEGVLEVFLSTDEKNDGNVFAFLVDDQNKIIDMSYDNGYGDFYIESPGTYKVFIALYNDTGNLNVPYEAYFAYTKNY